MRLAWFGLLAAAALAAQPVAARDELRLPAAAAIESMCSPEGTHLYSFGQTGVPGADRLTRTVSAGFALPASAAPFDRAKPWATEWSDRFFGMEYLAPDGGEEDFSVFVARLDRLLEAAGWTLQPEDFDPPLYMLTMTGDRTWLRPIGAGSEATQLVLGLSRAGGQVTLGCGRADLMLAHASEAFGNLPPGTPRPRVPAIPAPALRDEADCGKPEIVADMRGLFGSPALDDFMTAMVARTTYRDRLTTWMAWKLEESGKIPDEDLANLIFSAAGDASPGGNPFAQLTMLGELLDLAERLDEAEASGDPVELCRALAQTHDWYTRVDALTLRQTEAAQTALSEEAARLGVSLD